MLLRTETYKHQSKLAMYCRDGKKVEIPGMDPDRLPTYRRLVFNVVKDALETTYPITVKFIGTELWDELAYSFFSSHKCRDPQVWRMPEEFYTFCVEEDFAKKYDLPFLHDLLYFEWLEVELYMMEDIPYPGLSENDGWYGSRIAVNPEHKLVRLEYPVHMYNPLEVKDKKGEYFLLLFREKETGKIQFTNLSVLFAFLLENITNTTKTLEEIMNDILYVFGINDLEMLQEETSTFLNNLYKRGFILGALE